MKRKNTVTWESLDKDKWTIDKGQKGLYYCTHVSFNKKLMDQIKDLSNSLSNGKDSKNFIVTIRSKECRFFYPLFL